MKLKNSMPTMAVLLASNAIAAQECPAKNTEKPNVLFLFVDDMTFDGLNILGNDQIISPNLDKLLARGVSFTNAYNMGAWNGAVSVASRSQLFTGKHVWRSHQSEKNRYTNELKNRTAWSLVMKDAGYNTYMTGKWHVKAVKPEKVFDQVGTERPGMPNVHPSNFPNAYNRPLSRDCKKWDPTDLAGEGYWLGGKHWSEVQADEIIAYLEQSKNSDNPFFMYCAFNAPHDPRQSPQEYLDMYDVDKIKLPATYQDLHPYGEEMSAGKGLRDEQLAPFPRTKYAVKKHLQEYYAIITHLDTQIGRIMETLEKNNLYDNTLIVFAADNGLAMGQHGLLGKQSMYEHSTKIPLVFIGQGLPEGQTRDQLVYMQDLIPTVYEMIGVQKPKGMDFQSQLAAVKDAQAASTHEYIYGAYRYTQRMVRNDQYKLFFVPAAQKVFLYDLKNDPLETKNLYGNKKYDKIVEDLLQNYLRLAKAADDEFSLFPFFHELFAEYSNEVFK